MIDPIISSIDEGPARPDAPPARHATDPMTPVELVALLSALPAHVVRRPLTAETARETYVVVGVRPDGVLQLEVLPL